MRISTIALANLKRRKSKAAFLAAGIALGIGTAVALLTLSDSIRKEIGTQLDQFGANIVVVPKSDSLALDYGGVAVSGVAFDTHELTESDAARLADIPYRNRLSAVAPKLIGAADVEGRQVLLAGVNFAEELKLKGWWQISGAVPAADAEVLVGHEVARSLGLLAESPEPAAAAAPADDPHARHGASGSADAPQLKPTRDRLRIAGQDHRVAGILHATGGAEDRMVFGTLDRVQALLGKPDQLSLIEVSALCKDCPVGDIVDQIAAQLPDANASAVQQAVVAREQTVERLGSFATAVSGVVLAIGALLIFTTMTGSVLERTREIGVLRAIGFRKRHIIHGLVIEVAAISLLGGVAGWAAGTLVSWAALPYFAETELAFELRPLFVPFAVGAALLVGLLSSVHPILRAARLDPSESVRYV